MLDSLISNVSAWTGIDLSFSPTPTDSEPQTCPLDEAPKPQPEKSLGYCESDGGDIFLPVEDVVLNLSANNPDAFELPEDASLARILRSLGAYQKLQTQVQQLNTDNDPYISETEFLSSYANPLENHAGAMCIDRDAFDDFSIHYPTPNPLAFSAWEMQGQAIQTLLGYRLSERIEITENCSPSRQIITPALRPLEEILKDRIAQISLRMNDDLLHQADHLHRLAMCNPRYSAVRLIIPITVNCPPPSFLTEDDRLNAVNIDEGEPVSTEPDDELIDDILQDAGFEFNNEPDNALLDSLFENKNIDENDDNEIPEDAAEDAEEFEYDFDTDDESEDNNEYDDGEFIQLKSGIGQNGFIDPFGNTANSF